MSAIASQITSLTVVSSAVYSRCRSKKTSKLRVTGLRGIHRWPVNSSHKWPVTRKIFPFDDVIVWTKMTGYLCDSPPLYTPRRSWNSIHSLAVQALRPRTVSDHSGQRAARVWCLQWPWPPSWLVPVRSQHPGPLGADHPTMADRLQLDGGEWTGTVGWDRGSQWCVRIGIRKPYSKHMFVQGIFNFMDIIFMGMTWSRVSVHWRLGRCQLFANCFLR